MSEDNEKQTGEQELTPEQLDGVAGGVIAVSHEVKSQLSAQGPGKLLEDDGIFYIKDSTPKS